MKLLVRKIMIETLKDNTYSESDPEVEVEVAALSAANLVQFDIFVLSLMISMIVSTKNVRSEQLYILSVIKFYKMSLEEHLI